MKDYSKTATFGKPAVRQIKGPGMNLGLKKRHKLAKPKPFRDPTKQRTQRTEYGKAKGQAKSKRPSGGFLTKGFF